MGGARVNVIGEAGCTLRAVFHQFDLTPSEGCFGGLVFGGRGEVYLGIRRLATFAGSSKLTVPQATEQALCLGKKGGDLAPAAFSCWNFVQILGWQGLKSLRENSRIREGRGAHRRSLRSATPGFPVDPDGVGALHAPFPYRKAHTRPCPVQRGRKSGYAPVGMTLLFGNAKSCFQDELSSRTGEWEQSYREPPAMEGITRTSSPSLKAYSSLPRKRMSSSLT